MANAIEREFLERERTKLTVRLERARRMQMIGTLASGIAHNFNNIIGAILGYSEMVAMLQAMAGSDVTPLVRVSWNAPGEILTIFPLVASSAMPPRNSRNWVERMMV